MRKSRTTETLLDMPRDWYRARDIAKHGDGEGQQWKVGSITAALNNMHKAGIVEKRKDGDYKMAPVFWRLTKKKKEARADYEAWQNGVGE